MGGPLWLQLCLTSADCEGALIQKNVESISLCLQTSFHCAWLDRLIAFGCPMSQKRYAPLWLVYVWRKKSENTPWTDSSPAIHQNWRAWPITFLLSSFQLPRLHINMVRFLFTLATNRATVCCSAQDGRKNNLACIHNKSSFNFQLITHIKPNEKYLITYVLLSVIRHTRHVLSFFRIIPRSKSTEFIKAMTYFCLQHDVYRKMTYSCEQNDVYKTMTYVLLIKMCTHDR